MIIDIGVVKNIYEMISYYNSQYTKNDRIILDPLTTMCKLALLAFKPIGTKIVFDNNNMILQEPAKLQGFWRKYYYGSSKDQIHHLLIPITRAIKRYPITNPHIKVIFQTSIIGLERLKNTYNNDSSTAVHSLELYIQTITEALDTSETRPRSSSLCKLLEDDDTRPCIFKDLWNDKQIEIIANMIKQIETHKYDTYSYIDAIDTILTTQEDKARRKIKELTESL